MLTGSCMAESEAGPASQHTLGHVNFTALLTCKNKITSDCTKGRSSGSICSLNHNADCGGDMNVAQVSPQGDTHAHLPWTPGEVAYCLLEVWNNSHSVSFMGYFCGVFVLQKFQFVVLWYTSSFFIQWTFLSLFHAHFPPLYFFPFCFWQFFPHGDFHDFLIFPHCFLLLFFTLFSLFPFIIFPILQWLWYLLERKAYPLWMPQGRDPHPSNVILGSPVSVLDSFFWFFFCLLMYFFWGFGWIFCCKNASSASKVHSHNGGEEWKWVALREPLQSSVQLEQHFCNVWVDGSE